jgi:hypothetical protein
MTAFFETRKKTNHTYTSAIPPVTAPSMQPHPVTRILVSRPPRDASKSKCSCLDKFDPTVGFGSEAGLDRAL